MLNQLIKAFGMAHHRRLCFAYNPPWNYQPKGSNGVALGLPIKTHKKEKTIANGINS